MTTKPFQNAFIGLESTEIIAAALTRLMANLPGFVYRCRPDARRTMEFVSDHCRHVTGYDPHRFIDNQSLTYALLIHPDDRARVDRTVFDGAMRGRRFICSYRVHTAYGSVIEVVDRGVGVLDGSGALCAIEGYVCRAGETGRQPRVSLAEETLAVAAGFEDHPAGFIADDDATAELADRLLPARTREIPVASSHVD